MALIYNTKNFILESHDRPFVSREDGGHIKITVKDKSITDRTKLSVDQAIELMRFSIIVGKAFEKVMNAQGIPVVKINYQDMGNWAWKQGVIPHLHLHIFGRSENAKKQVFPEAVYLPDRSTGFYEGFVPLSAEDISLLKSEIDYLFDLEEYSDATWRI